MKKEIALGKDLREVREKNVVIQTNLLLVQIHRIAIVESLR